MYSGLTAQGIASNLERINENFPSTTKGFYKILCDRVKTHKFTDFEFTRAVNHVIDTCKFPNPMVGEFISFILNERPRPEERPPEELTEEEKRREQEESDAWLTNRQVENAIIFKHQEEMDRLADEFEQKRNQMPDDFLKTM